MKNVRFMKPEFDDDLWKEDLPDIDNESNTVFVFNRNISLSLNEQRNRLPIAKYKLKILYVLENYQVLVLVGDTGCGKSTQIPQYLKDAGWCENGLMIGITEPRRFCATSLAARVAEEQCTKLGSDVGYSIRFDECYSKDQTKIKYMTEGILIREMMADPLLRSYSIIMLDEVHERTVLTDILMGLIKKILKKRKTLKLIVSSATVDAENLKKYFNVRKNESESDTAAILSVNGKSYPITMHYLVEHAPDYVKSSVDCVMKIHNQELPGDILVFLTGSEEVENAVSMIKENIQQHTKTDTKLLILPMYGSLSNSEQLKVFRPAPRGFRKVIVATNIAETSVTISGVVYVVDCGFVKMKWFNAETYTDSLIIVPISKASAEQRAGRAGRTMPGNVYRLYTESEFEKLETATPAEMCRTDLSSALLLLKALSIDNVLRFSFPSPPPAHNLKCALELLYALGAIDDNGQLTSDLGVQMAEFPLHPMHSKVLLKAGEMNCTEELSIILAMMQVDNVFVRPYRGADSVKARIAKRKFEVHEGDLITLLNVYVSFMKYTTEQNAKTWCAKNFINYKAIARSHKIKTQMLKLLERFGISNLSCNGDTKTVLKCIASGFFPNAAYLHSSGVYRTVRGDQELYIHPSSVLYDVEQPRWLLYCELLQTNKLFMKNIITIESSWLEEVAPNFYHTTASV